MHHGERWVGGMLIDVDSSQDGWREMAVLGLVIWSCHGMETSLEVIALSVGQPGDRGRARRGTGTSAVGIKRCRLDMLTMCFVGWKVWNVQLCGLYMAFICQK